MLLPVVRPEVRLGLVVRLMMRRSMMSRLMMRRSVMMRRRLMMKRLMMRRLRLVVGKRVSSMLGPCKGKTGELDAGTLKPSLNTVSWRKEYKRKRVKQ